MSQRVASVTHGHIARDGDQNQRVCVEQSFHLIQEPLRSHQCYQECEKTRYVRASVWGRGCEAWESRHRHVAKGALGRGSECSPRQHTKTVQYYNMIQTHENNTLK